MEELKKLRRKIYEAAGKPSYASRPENSKAGEAQGVKYSEKAKREYKKALDKAASQDSARAAKEKQRKKRRRKEIESQGYRKMN